MSVVEVSIGGQVVKVMPLRDPTWMAELKAAIEEEVGAREAAGEGPLVPEIDIVRLLRLGLPDVITDELLEQATVWELRDLYFAMVEMNMAEHER